VGEDIGGRRDHQRGEDSGERSRHPPRIESGDDHEDAHEHDTDRPGRAQQFLGIVAGPEEERAGVFPASLDPPGLSFLGWQLPDDSASRCSIGVHHQRGLSGGHAPFAVFEPSHAARNQGDLVERGRRGGRGTAADHHRDERGYQDQGRPVDLFARCTAPHRFGAGAGRTPSAGSAYVRTSME
jgi:hypothetical protein